MTNGDNQAQVQGQDQLEQPPSSNVEFSEEAIATGAQAPLTEAALPAVPQAMMGSGIDRLQTNSCNLANYKAVQSEDMKNLMLSWYYAGYYTGLYEGKQQGYVSAKQQSAG